MTSARWLICDLGKPEKIQEMYYSVLETGRQAEVVPLKRIAEIYDTTSNERDCVITMGSIWGNSAIRECRPNWFGNFHNRQMFLCSTYYSYWGKYITQKQYVMMTLAEVVRKADWLYEKLSVDGKVFIRPDSGEKEFAGEIVDRGRFDAWKESVIGGPVQQSPSLLCIVSSPVNIRKEMRLVIADKKVIAGSTYRIAKHLSSEPLKMQDEEDTDAAIRFAELVLNDNPPPLPIVHCLDVALEEDGEYSVMEVGCFCCCGLYECDRKAIARSVSESVEKVYEKSLA